MCNRLTIEYIINKNNDKYNTSLLYRLNILNNTFISIVLTINVNK